MGKKIKFLLAFALLLCLALTGCQTAQMQEAATESQAAQKDAQEEDEYIDADYVDENYDDTEEDLDKYNASDSKGTDKTADKTTNKNASGSSAQENTQAGSQADPQSEAQDDASGEPAGNTDEQQQDEYQTAPVPEGVPQPVEPQDVTVDESQSLSCSLYVECSTILNNMDDLAEGKETLVPSDGVIYGPVNITFYEGESVYDILLREMQNNRIHMESEFTAANNSSYIKAINNLYERDCGDLSGWRYCVNGRYPNYGCSRYQVQNGDTVELHYTCDLGRDLGADVPEGN